MSPRVLVCIADGSEEIEVMTAANVLVRGQCEVTIASVGGSLDVTGSRQLPLKAQKLISECERDEFDMIVLPGGMPGAKNLFECNVLKRMLQKQSEAGRWIAAICAAPAVVLDKLQLLPAKSTCYPGFELSTSENTQSAVEVSGKVVTGRGPGTAMQFALKCVECLVGAATSGKVAQALLFASEWGSLSL